MTPSLFGKTSLAHPYLAGDRFSPLVLADRLISLAQEADGAGYRTSAARLIGLAYAVLDDEGPSVAAA